ncbi:hypothetical protein FWH13_01345 [Candidatus Saccharibacteria bacterium]|nr:hypothetical protein [Candidatus Saccharibacteria bacterium]
MDKKSAKKSQRWKILAWLVGVMAVMLALHLILMTARSDWETYWWLVGPFDMDSEISIFTWWSTTVLLFVPAILLGFIGWVKRQEKAKYAWGWFVAAGVLMFMSMDDGAMLHERLGAVNELSGLQGVLDGINPYLLAWSWWVIYLPVLVAIAVILVPWFLSLPRRTQVLMIVGAVMAGLGQMGMEAVSSFVTNSTGEYIGPVWRGFQKFVGRTGLSIFLFAVIDYCLSDSGVRKRIDGLLQKD